MISMIIVLVFWTENWENFIWIETIIQLSREAQLGARIRRLVVHFPIFFIRYFSCRKQECQLESWIGSLKVSNYRARIVNLSKEVGSQVATAPIAPHFVLSNVLPLSKTSTFLLSPVLLIAFSFTRFFTPLSVRLHPCCNQRRYRYFSDEIEESGFHSKSNSFFIVP